MKYIIPILFVCLCFTSCDESLESSTSTSLLLNISGLRVAGSEYDYFVYADQGSAYKNLGSFDINTSGNLNNSLYSIREDDLATTQGFLITLDKEGTTSDEPSGTHILRGNLINKGAALTVAHEDILPIDFTDIAGSFVLETPTDLDGGNFQNGIWFGTTEALLDLPELPANWTYESWILLQDTITLSLGKFSSASSADNSNAYSGTEPGYNYPGEDFLVNSPDTTLDFPYDLRGRFTWISIEPIPDNDLTKPYGRRILQASIDSDLKQNEEQEFLQTSPMFPQGLMIVR